MALITAIMGSPWVCLALVVVVCLYRNDIHAALGRVRRIELPGVKFDFGGTGGKSGKFGQDGIAHAGRYAKRIHRHAARRSK